MGGDAPGLFKVHWLLLTAATAWALRYVPAFPRFVLDDPNHWAVLGYLVVVLVLLIRGRRSTGLEPHSRLLRLFLVAMPVVYLADWWRYGGSRSWLVVELAGAAVFWSCAVLAKRSPVYLVIGIGGHAFWDLIHFRTSTYIADWYAWTCMIVDVAIAVVVVRLIRESGVAR